MSIPTYVKCPKCRHRNKVVNEKYLILWKDSPEYAISQFDSIYCKICKKMLKYHIEDIVTKEDYITKW